MVQVGPRAATSAATQTPDAPPAAPDQGLKSPPVEAESETPAQLETPAARRWRRYSVEIPIDPEYLPFLGLMFVGLVLRFWDLGVKAYHHDESLHAFYSWRLFDGQGYVHDPMMHGPLLFELNDDLTVKSFRYLGDPEAIKRATTAVAGQLRQQT